MLDGKAIVSSSKDRTIYIKSLDPELDIEDGQVPVGFNDNEDFLCVTVIKDQINKNELTCAIGTSGGKLLLYSAANRFSFSSYEEIQVNIEKKKEGCINLVLYQYGFLIWATKCHIYVKHYDRD